MELYEDCQKILCVDGDCDPVEGFQIVNIKRPNKYYNWSSAWEQGVQAADFDNILYIDADRVLPVDYLTTLLEMYGDKTFVFPEKVANLNQPVDTSLLREIREDSNSFEGYYDLETRATDLSNCIGRKNPMSGCVGFTKQTYFDSGKVDPYYEGWGYPDTDYFMQTFNLGFQFKKVPCVELHIHHSNDIRKGKGLMNLWNGVRFCRKWDLPIADYLIRQSHNLRVSIQEMDEFNDMESFVDHHIRNTLSI